MRLFFARMRYPLLKSSVGPSGKLLPQTLVTRLYLMPKLRGILIGVMIGLFLLASVVAFVLSVLVVVLPGMGRS